MIRGSKSRSNRETPAAGIWGVIRSWIVMAPVALLLASIAVLPAAAGEKNAARRGGKRLAPDLVEALRKGSPAGTARLVVKFRKSGHKTGKRAVDLGGRVVGVFPRVNQMVLELPLGSVEALLTADGLEYVTPDREVYGLASDLQIVTGASQVLPANAPPKAKSKKSKAKKDRDPEPAGFDGRGVVVAVIDSGIDAKRKDLKKNGELLLRVDFTGQKGPDDPYGHGTYIAGVIAGDGAAARKAGLDYAGIAPGASLVDLRVLDGNGRGRLSDVIAAIDFAIAVRTIYDIRVLNLSLASPPVESQQDDPLCQAVARAVQAGLVVVTAAGNFGLDANDRIRYGSITSPGISPFAITVGATHSSGTHVRSDDTVAPFSSRGPTWSGSPDPLTGEIVHDFLAKPDLVAPGVGIVSLGEHKGALLRALPGLALDTNKVGKNDLYMVLSGTSVSTGVVSGAVALMLEANPSLTPNEVKTILMYSAQILDGPDLFEQGAGQINIEGAVRLARAVGAGAASPPPDPTVPEFVFDGVPASTIAGEPVAWSQGLIWGRAWVRGGSVLHRQNRVQAQGLIWGNRRNVWSAGAVIHDGLFTDDQVVFGDGGDWHYVTWDEGTELENGAVLRSSLSTSGVSWRHRLIIDDFFSVEPAGLIWGYQRFTFSQGLIWGYTCRSLTCGVRR